MFDVVFNSKNKISEIILMTDCKKHDSRNGLPCWSIGEAGYAAICNSRAKKMYNGFITTAARGLDKKGYR